MSQPTPTYGVILELRVITDEIIPKQPTVTLASSILDVPCSETGEIYLDVVSRYRPSKSKNFSEYVFKTEDRKFLSRLVEEIWNSTVMVTATLIYGSSKLYLGSTYIVKRLEDGGKMTIESEIGDDGEPTGYHLLKIRSYHLSILFANLIIEGEITFSEGSSVKEIFNYLKWYFFNNIVFEDMKRLYSLFDNLIFWVNPNYDRLELPLSFKPGMTVYDIFKRIGEVGYMKYPIEPVFRTHQVLFGGGIPFEETSTGQPGSQNYNFMLQTIVDDVDELPNKIIKRPKREYNESLAANRSVNREVDARTHTTRHERIRNRSSKQCPQYSITVSANSLMAGAIKYKGILRMLNMAVVPQPFDSAEINFIDSETGTSVGDGRIIILNSIITYNGGESAPFIDFTGLNYWKLHDILIDNSSDQFPTINNFTIMWNMSTSSTMMDDVRKEIDKQVSEIETISIGSVRDSNEVGDILNVFIYQTRPQNAEDVVRGYSKKNTNEPTKINIVKTTPLAGDGYGIVIPKYRDANLMIHHIEKNFVPGMAGNEWWTKDQEIPPHEDGDILVKTKGKKSQALMSEDGDIVLEGQYVIIDANPTYKNQRPTINKGINPNEILLGKNAILKNARENDTIQISTVTDPINMLSLFMVCAMFGLPFSSPMSGIINGGSSKVKSE